MATFDGNICYANNYRLLCHVWSNALFIHSQKTDSEKSILPGNTMTSDGRACRAVDQPMASLFVATFKALLDDNFVNSICSLQILFQWLYNYNTCICIKLYVMLAELPPTSIWSSHVGQGHLTPVRSFSTTLQPSFWSVLVSSFLAARRQHPSPDIPIIFTPFMSKPHQSDPCHSYFLSKPIHHHAQ